MKKIAVLGTHGVGKSTLCSMLMAHYKKKGGNVDLIQERIRYSPFPYNEEMTEDTALWAYHAQVARELESKARGFNTIICDRTAIDCFFYAKYWGIKNKQIANSHLLARRWLTTYDRLIFIAPDSKLFTDGIRSDDLDFQEGVNTLMLRYLSRIMYSSVFINKIVMLTTSQIFNPQFKIEELL